MKESRPFRDFSDESEATYLAWVDFSGTGMEREQFTSRIRNVGLAPSAGQSFGPEGELCMRFNTPPARPS